MVFGLCDNRQQALFNMCAPRKLKKTTVVVLPKTIINEFVPRYKARGRGQKRAIERVRGATFVVYGRGIVQKYDPLLHSDIASYFIVEKHCAEQLKVRVMSRKRTRACDSFRLGACY